MTAEAVATGARARAKRKRMAMPRVALHGFLLVTAILWLAPVGWALFTSFRPYSDTQAHGYVSIPHTLSIANYRHAWSQGQIPQHLWNSMKTIPSSLSEAARVDGAGVARQFFGIILPLCKPALAALATLEFTWIYNDFLW